MSKRNGFVLFRDSWPLIELLTYEQRGIFLTAVFAYNFGGKLPEMDTPTRMAFLEAKERIDKAADKYDATCERRREAANKRWHPDANVCKAMQSNANDAEIRKKKEEIENIKENSPTESKRKAFVPPTVDEVREYVNEKGYKVDPESFVAFYTAKGWMIGKNKMKDWKAATRTWVRQDKGRANQIEPKESKYANLDFGRLLNKGD